MKRFFILVLFIGISTSMPSLGQDGGSARDEVLIGGIEENGGYGAPTLAVTSFNGEAALLSGGQGGWIINRQFVLGVGGRGVATRHRTTYRGEEADLRMGYGGLLIEYIAAPSSLVHLGGELLIGGGGASYVQDSYNVGYVAEHNENALESAPFFASEIGGRVEINVTTFFRFGVSGGYRLIAGSELSGVSDSDLRGPYGQLSLRFGRF